MTHGDINEHENVFSYQRIIMKHKNQNLKIILIIAVFLIIAIISFNALIAYNISHPKRKPVPVFYYPTLAMNYSAITFASNDIKLKGWFIANDSNESNATIIIAQPPDLLTV